MTFPQPAEALGNPALPSRNLQRSGNVSKCEEANPMNTLFHPPYKLLIWITAIPIAAFATYIACLIVPDIVAAVVPAVVRSVTTK